MRGWRRLAPAAWLVLVMAVALGGLRPACPMHAATGGTGHHRHGASAPVPSPCSCIGDCVVPVVPSLGRPPVIPAASLVLSVTVAFRARSAVRDTHLRQLRLPFATAPPA